MLAEHALIHGVHLLEFLHVDEEHAAAQRVLQVAARRLENGLHVLEALLRLRGGIGADDFSGGRIGRALAGDEDEAFEAHAR